MARNKGQVAVEFLMYAGLFMTIAIGAYLLVSFTERGEVSLRESQLINAFGYKFASAPTIAYKGGDGFTYDVGVAQNVDGRPYNVTYICKGISSGDGSCYVQVAWEGTYQPFNYPYTIAPAKYEKGGSSGTSNCLSDVSSGGYSAIYFDPGASDGHLIFKNTGIQPGDLYPTIEMYCEVT